MSSPSGQERSITARFTNTPVQRHYIGVWCTPLLRDKYYTVVSETPIFSYLSIVIQPRDWILVRPTLKLRAGRHVPWQDARDINNNCDFGSATLGSRRKEKHDTP